MKTRLPGNLATVLNLHLAGLALLVIVNLFLLTKLAIAWHDANSQRPEVVQQEKLADGTRHFDAFVADQFA